MDGIHRQKSNQHQHHTHHQKDQSTGRSRFIRLPEVIDCVSLSRTSIYRRMNDGTFPKSVKLGSRAIAWQESSIDQWIADRINSTSVEEVQS